MSDITKCQDRTCSFKDSCYRYTAQPKENFQSWFVKSPRTATDCEFYYGCKNNYETIKEKLLRTVEE
jgi:hypothetical protein